MPYGDGRKVLAMQWIAYWGLTAIAASLLAVVIAGGKNRDISYWAGWSFLVPPLVLLLLVMPKRQGPRPRQPRLDEIDRDSGMY